MIDMTQIMRQIINIDHYAISLNTNEAKWRLL